ncbi:MAG TPA: hypothetical protein VMK82_07250 [Steroidobacteraceae bacterium]|nr:hypothetical protein [Steroidobacteraceae bacterium]
MLAAERAAQSGAARGRGLRGVRICGALIIGVKLSSASVMLAATHTASVETLGATAELQALLPQSREFIVSAGGPVRITLSDLAAPEPFVELQLLVSRGGQKVLALSGAGAQQFPATPGVYSVQVLGTPAPATDTSSPAGTFDVEVRELTGNTVLFQFAAGIAALPSPPRAQSTVAATLQIETAGTYQVTFNDRSLPAALSLIDVGVFGGNDRLVTISGPCSAAAGCTTSFTASTPGSYPLLVAATAANPDQAGLYSLRVSGPGGAVVYSATQPVGRLAPATAITLPAAGGYTLAATDHEMPVALSALRFRLMQGATELAALNASGSVAFTAPSTNPAQLFAFGRAVAGTGTYSLRLAQGAQSVFRDLRTLPDGYDVGLNAGGYHYTFDVPSTTSYRLRLRDLNFPAPLAQLRAVVVPASGTVQAVNGTDIDSTFQLAAGPAWLAVIGQTSGPSANSLLGVSLAPVAGGSSLLDRAQGLGPLFSTQTLIIPAAGSYDVTIRDLQFPAAFQELAAAVTRGPELVGQVFGSEKIRFDAQPGTYSLNLLARPSATAQYATWGFELADTPPAPVLALSADPVTVPRDGTTTISWSAIAATACSATGGWSGTRALSGTETSAVLAADTTFTLSCVGDGGSTSRSVTVAVSAPAPDGGGGGSLGAGALLGLAGLLGALRRRASRY